MVVSIVPRVGFCFSVEEDGYDFRTSPVGWLQGIGGNINRMFSSLTLPIDCTRSKRLFSGIIDISQVQGLTDHVVALCCATRD